MKYKTYRWVLGLFLGLLFGVITLLATLNFKENLARVKESYAREYSFLVKSMAKDLIALGGRGYQIEAAVDACIKDYGKRYEQQKIYLQLYEKEKCLYSSLKEEANGATEKMSTDTGKIMARVVASGRTKYICVSGYLPDQYGNYLLVYYTDITRLIDGWVHNVFYLLIGTLLFSMVLSVCLLILIEHLFKPLETISAVSKKIAAGDYNKKLEIKGEGEIGEVVRSFNTMTDTINSQMKRLEENAAEKQRLIDNLAHELRTPLTAIYGYAEYMQKTNLSEQDKYVSTQFILHESKRLKTISEMLLNLAVLREESQLEMGKINVEALFKRLHQIENIKLREKHIQFSIQNTLQSLYGNEELIEGMLINLIDNAIKACDKEESKIMVKAYEEEAHQVIEVIDNGKGMNKEQISHVTEAFYRVDKSRSRSEGGNGLGLNLCQLIIDKHGAKLKIASEETRGTCVSVIFNAKTN